MTRAHFVLKARKDNSVCKAGESYWWWKFRHGGKRFSLTQPRSSQLTQSAYYSTIRSICEGIDDWTGNAEDLETLRDELVAQLQDAGEECQESFDNIPESLQEAPTGELLQERISTCEGAVSELENVDLTSGAEEVADDDDLDEEEKEQALQDWIDETTSEFSDFVSECEV